MFGTLSTVLLTVALGASSGATPPANVANYERQVQAMKTQPRGPFVNVRWFCKDGSLLPPKSYACAQHGGGHQHGQWSKTTKNLRAHDYRIANFLAGLDPKAFVAQRGYLDAYNQILIEKFLIAADNGWILRKALFYRGAIQEEDERAGAHDLLVGLAGSKEWIGLRYPALRIGVRMLPHGDDNASVQKVRQESAALSDSDSKFIPLRSKIHGAPDAGDAQRVRDYAAKVSNGTLKARYQALADEIDGVYQAAPLPELLESYARKFSGGPWLQKILRSTANAYQRNNSADNHYQVSAKLLADLRDALTRVRSASARVSVLDLSLAVEAESFRASAKLREQLPQANRKQRVQWLRAAGNAAYGSGLINPRSHQALDASLARLSHPSVSLDDYLKQLNYLGRVPGWATQTLRFQFFESMSKLAQVEPKAHLFIQDQLRGSPLLFYSQVLDSLVRDGNQLAGVQYKLFGKTIGSGFRALNPGLARGVLHTKVSTGSLASLQPNGIYVLPETVSDLPPVSGILTAGAGNPLSHIQLLARNLGIPNVAVDERLLPQLAQHDGEKIVMAVSPAGLVELADDGPRWDTLFGESKGQQDVVIRPDLKKLNISETKLLDLNGLRARDSGRVVGPKAAKLGELHHAFPEAVAPGLAIPFGTFKTEVLDRPHAGSTQTVYDWMVQQYRHLQSLPEGSAKRKQQTEAFRAELYDIILHVHLSNHFKAQLKQGMTHSFGGLSGYGVFIRSDTNVEDLPGFTGAGLNLTLPNVVGFNNVVKGIPKVWASPFTARAFAWRQSHMDQPEHVYPAVLLLKSVPNDKSGVMVTQDIDTGNRDVISVAVNEGVGGAVDGQAAESLRINTKTGDVTLLATATAPWRRKPTLKGGVDKQPASGTDEVLKPGEIKQLIAFAKQLPQRFPDIVDDQGNPAPADVEYGFLDGKLQLFQLRPFLESRKARGSSYLSDMDGALAAARGKSVSMHQVPK